MDDCSISIYENFQTPINGGLQWWGKILDYDTNCINFHSPSNNDAGRDTKNIPIISAQAQAIWNWENSKVKTASSLSNKNEKDVGSILEGTLHRKKVTSWYVQHYSSTVANVKPQYEGRSLIDNACMKQGKNKNHLDWNLILIRSSCRLKLEPLNREPNKYEQNHYKGQQ